jgi:hypothetical protein
MSPHDPKGVGRERSLPGTRFLCKWLCRACRFPWFDQIWLEKHAPDAADPGNATTWRRAGDRAVVGKRRAGHSARM